MNLSAEEVALVLDPEWRQGIRVGQTTTSPPPVYDHRVQAVFDPGDATGFVYTIGMPRQELFALNVPREWAESVAGCMNFISSRQVSESQTVQSGDDLIFQLRGLEGRTDLMTTHLVQMDPSAEVLELYPIFGWRRSDACVEREEARGE